MREPNDELQAEAKEAQEMTERARADAKEAACAAEAERKARGLWRGSGRRGGGSERGYDKLATLLEQRAAGTAWIGP